MQAAKSAQRASGTGEVAKGTGIQDSFLALWYNRVDWWLEYINLLLYDYNFNYPLLELFWRIDFVHGVYSYSRHQVYHKTGVMFRSNSSQKHLHDQALTHQRFWNASVLWLPLPRSLLKPELGYVGGFEERILEPLVDVLAYCSLPTYPLAAPWPLSESGRTGGMSHQALSLSLTYLVFWSPTKSTGTSRSCSLTLQSCKWLYP